MSVTPESLIVLGRRRGRKPLFGVRSTRRIEIVVTEQHYSTLKQVAADQRKPVTEVVRCAVDEFVGDYRERIFTLREFQTRGPRFRLKG